MLFNSFEFIFCFLPITFIIHLRLGQLNKNVAAKVWLITASLFFYGWFNTAYLPIIICSTTVNYFLSKQIIKAKTRKKSRPILYTGLTFNLILLGYFKYADFFVTTINTLFAQNLTLLNMALPLAISFFTLQQITYLVDCYEGLVEEEGFINYSLFVTFFPQLLAGPIVHHKMMIPQFKKSDHNQINLKNIAAGLFIFSSGLFKKIIISGQLESWNNRFIQYTDSLNMLEAWISSFAYTFQIYFDFSGYTDMAIGIALLFYIVLPLNFNSPLKATSMIDFWNRWHMTLTNFLMSYVYTPTIRSFDKITLHNAMLVTLFTFFISGLWHGASWMFIAFGVLNGIGIVINHYWKKVIKIKLNKKLAWALTFIFINFTLVFFRASTATEAFRILRTMLSFSSVAGVERFSNLYYIISLLAGCFAIILTLRNNNSNQKNFKATSTNLLLALVLFISSCLNLDSVTKFIYFNF